MAGYQNNMSDLVSRIERRLELTFLSKYIPEEYSKDKWPEIISEDSLTTFSRYYPRKIPFKVTDQTAPRKNGWRYIDESYIGNQKILGVGDIDWASFNSNSIGLAQQFGYGLPDIGMTNFSIDDIQSLIMRANYASMFHNNVYPEFQEPNKLRLVAIGNREVNIGDYVIMIHVKHNDDLSTISPTKMETLDDLATSDIATFLLGWMKYWDGWEGIFMNIDLKISKLEDWSGRRESIVQKLEDSFVSAGNEAIPLMIVE